jgi:sterol desaturase/sphingolipid hydroxylase (fatty acid hydroxylase superfamily)
MALQGITFSECLKFELRRYKQVGLLNIILGLLQVFLFFKYGPLIASFFQPLLLKLNLPEGWTQFVYIMIFHEFLWLIINGIWCFMYLTKFKFFEDCKIHKDEPLAWDTPAWKDEILPITKKYLFVNHFIMIPCLMIPNIIFNKATNDIMNYREVSLWEQIIQIAFFILMDDFIFFHSHWLLHANKWMYQKIHKIHHTYKHTMSFAAEMSHPLEFFLANILSVSAGNMILGKRVAFQTSVMWIFYKLYSSTLGHSGYSFAWSFHSLIPFTTCKDFHEYHHLLFTGNYGNVFSIYDYLFKTVNPTYKKEIIYGEVGKSGKKTIDNVDNNNNSSNISERKTEKAE